MELKKTHKNLLALDGMVNILLGLFLLFFPAGLVNFLGLPQEINYFYASILGAVLFGIGIALFQERSRREKGSAGLGLAGAVIINCDIVDRRFTCAWHRAPGDIQRSIE